MTVQTEVVVASGLFIDCSIWQNFNNNLELICADKLRLHESVTMEDYVSEIINRLNPDKQVILIGHSYGVGLLIHVASKLGDRVKSFIMLNGIIPFYSSVFETYIETSQNILFDFIKLDYSAGLLRLDKTREYLNCLMSPDKTDFKINLAEAENIKLLTCKIENKLSSRLYPVIYVASEHDQITPFSTQLDFAKNSHADKVVCIKGGHMYAIFNRYLWMKYAK